MAILYSAQPFCTERMELGEGIVWDHINRRALWVDIPSGRVLEADETGALLQALKLPDLATTVVLAEGGSLIVSGARHVYRVERGGEAVAAIAALSQVPSGQRLNDGKCDSGGRLMVGSMMTAPGEPAGKLFSVSPDGEVRVLLEGLGCSNGIGFSPCGRYVYHIDTPTRQVRRYAYDARSGSLSRPVVLVDVSRFEGVPDGMTVDAQGRMYIAMWGGSSVLGFDAGGELCLRIQLPCKQVTSCAFGGTALEELLITTAGEGEEAANPYAGQVYRASVGAKGVPCYLFAGNK